MAERKVLNKYFPPDFDPTNLAPKTPWKEQKVVVRMMLPMNVQCKLCKEYMYRGTKFNTRKEDVEGETYLGIRLYRFYFKCTGCSQPFCLKTDPENADYVCETGVTRNFEPWRAAEAEKEDYRKRREAEEQGDAMKSLENRTEESRRELDFLDILAETREFNTKIAAANHDDALKKVGMRHEKMAKELTSTEEEQMKKAFENAARRRQEEEDKAMKARLAASAAEDTFASSVSSQSSSSSSSSSAKSAEDLLLARSGHLTKKRSLSTPLYKISFEPSDSKSKRKGSKSKKKKKKNGKRKKSKDKEKDEASASAKKQKTESNGTDESAKEEPKKPSVNALSLLDQYGSSSDSDS